MFFNIGLLLLLLWHTSLDSKVERDDGDFFFFFCGVAWSKLGRFLMRFSVHSII